MVDRLKELQIGGVSPMITNPVSDDTDMEAGAGGSGASDFMKNFFENVDTVKADIRDIKHACKKIQSINQEMMLATTADAEAKLSDALNPVLNKANKAAKRCKNTLKEMSEETEKLKAQGNSKQANELRIRENLGSTLSRKFVEVVKEYQKRQQDYKDDVKKKVTRQVRIVKEDATEEEIESVMQSGGSTEQLFQTAILTTAADSVKEAFEKAQDKYRDVQRLEQSVMELHQMFIDFALLTEQQGELLDQIEFNVKAAHEYISDGNVDIEVAIDYQKEIRKKQCCVMITVLIIGIVILAATGSFGRRRRRRRLSVFEEFSLVAEQPNPLLGSLPEEGGLLPPQEHAAPFAASDAAAAAAAAAAPGGLNFPLPPASFVAPLPLAPNVESALEGQGSSGSVGGSEMAVLPPAGASYVVADRTNKPEASSKTTSLQKATSTDESLESARATKAAPPFALKGDEAASTVSSLLLKSPRGASPQDAALPHLSALKHRRSLRG